MKRIYDLTVSLYAYLQQEDRKKEDRELTIEKVEKLLEERQALLEQMKPPYSDVDRELGGEIALYDEKINTLFKATLNDIKRDMTMLKHKKQQNNKYENPYASSYGDGMFFDKRK